MSKLTFLLLLAVVSAGYGRYHDFGADRDSDANSARNAESASLRPVKWIVVGGDQMREVTSGRTLPIVVQADIAKGWHIYSLTQKTGGPIPLRLDLVGAADVIIRGLIKAPKPDRTFDKNFGIETELYSGSPRFTIPVGVAARSLTGVRKFQVAARYQVCSDKLCLPPRTDKLDVTLRIASRR
jgi:thiol:disulfide interchange protein DsbD